VIAHITVAACGRRSVADLGWCIWTSDHLSLPVTAFLRRVKPVSPLTPSGRLERQGSKDSAARQKPEFPALGSAWRRSPIDTHERPTAARAAEERKKREPLTSRNRLVSRRTNSGKVVIYTIRGIRGKNPRNELISLGRREWQDWARLLPSSIAPERQKSALLRRLRDSEIIWLDRRNGDHPSAETHGF
jgi:hypothetical protein